MSFGGTELLGAKLSCLVAVCVWFGDHPVTGVGAEMVKGLDAGRRRPGVRCGRAGTFSMRSASNLAVATRALGSPTAARRATGTAGA